MVGASNFGSWVMAIDNSSRFVQFNHPLVFNARWAPPQEVHRDENTQGKLGVSWALATLGKELILSLQRLWWIYTMWGPPVMFVGL